MRRRVEQNELYTQYLKDTGLYVRDWRLDLIEKSKALRAEIEAAELKEKMELEAAQQGERIGNLKIDETETLNGDQSV